MASGGASLDSASCGYGRSSCGSWGWRSTALWAAAFLLVLLGYRPGGPVDLAVGLAAHRPDPRGARRRRVAARRARRPGVRRDRLARARRDPPARPVARAASSRSSRARGPQTLLPSVRGRVPVAPRARSRRGCSPGSGSPAGASARRRSAGGGSSSGSALGAGARAVVGIGVRRGGAWSTSWRSRTGPRSGRASGPRIPTLEVPELRRARSRSGETARLVLQMDSSIDDRRTGQLRLEGIRNGADFRYSGYVASRLALGPARHGPRPRAGVRAGAGPRVVERHDRRAANHDLDRALVLEALTPDQRAVAEDHGLSFIEGARARHCRVPLDGRQPPAGAAAGRRCSSARRTCRAGGATSTTGCSRTARSARWTDG